MYPVDVAQYRQPTNGKLPGKALHVGMAVWYVVGLAKGKRAKLTASALKRFGIRRDTGYRGLRRLEAAGLVSVNRKRGNCPVVSIVDSEKP